MKAMAEHCANCLNEAKVSKKPLKLACASENDFQLESQQESSLTVSAPGIIDHDSSKSDPVEISQRQGRLGFSIFRGLKKPWKRRRISIENCHSKQEEVSEPYKRPIRILSVTSSTEEFPGLPHDAQVVLDTGNPANLVCCNFVRDILRIALDRIDLFPDGARPIISWPNGDPFQAIGTVKIRWQSLAKRPLNLKIWIHPKVYDTTFYVSEECMFHSDLIIGSSTIHEHRFLHPVGLTGRRIPTPSGLKGAELEEARRKQQEARAQNERLVQEHKERVRAAAGALQAGKNTSSNRTDGVNESSG